MMTSTVPPPAVRLEHVCEAAGLVPDSAPRRIVSHSNDVWSLDDERHGPLVLRVSWRGDVARLGREVAVATRMPAAVRYPEVVGHGSVTVHGHDLAYSLTRRIDGLPLDLAWPTLSTARRHATMSQLGTMLRELHRWTPPADLTELVLARPYRTADRITGLLGADLNPLPVPRVVELAEHAAGVLHVSPGLMRAAVELLHRLAPVSEPIDDPSYGLIHGDLQLCNLWWSEPDVLTVLDLEWVRFGSPLLDLQRFCAQADTDARAGADTHPTVLRLLESACPEPFTGTDTAARLRLYTLAFAIRDVIVSPPDRAPSLLPDDHSLHLVRRLVEGSWPAPGALPDSLMS